MSRIGKLPVALPKGVKASIGSGVIMVEGPKGKLQIPVLPLIEINISEAEAVISTKSNSRQSKANWGTLRALLNNAVKGVTQGWQKDLELQGVGFTAALKGKVLTLATGYSHKSDVVIPDQVDCTVEKQSVKLSSCNKHLLGETAATIRAICPPEPYLGKGIRYVGENVRRKAGKTGAK